MCKWARLHNESGCFQNINLAAGNNMDQTGEKLKAERPVESLLQ